MISQVELQYAHKKGVNYLAEVIENSSNYLNAQSLFENQSELVNAILIENKVNSIQVQLDLQSAPQLFVIALDEADQKTGISFNYTVSKAPYSIMLSEKKYLLLPFDLSIEVGKIVSVKIG